MKIISIILLFISSISFADNYFKYQVPKPTKIHSDSSIDLGGDGGSSVTPPSSTFSFSANNSSSDITITIGSSVTLSWITDDTGFLTLNGSNIYDPMMITTSTIVTPNETTTYVLNNGLENKSITINVLSDDLVALDDGTQPDPVLDSTWTKIANDSTILISEDEWDTLRNNMQVGIIVTVQSNSYNYFASRTNLINANCKSINDSKDLNGGLIISWNESDCDAIGLDYDIITIGTVPSNIYGIPTRTIYSSSSTSNANKLFYNSNRSDRNYNGALTIKEIYIK